VPAVWAFNGKLKPISFASTPGQGTEFINAGPTVAVPDFSGLDERKVADECQSLGLDLTLSGSGLAVEQDPVPGTKTPEGSHVDVLFAR